MIPYKKPSLTIMSQTCQYDAPLHERRKCINQVLDALTQKHADKLQAPWKFAWKKYYLPGFEVFTAHLKRNSY